MAPKRISRRRPARPRRVRREPPAGLAVYTIVQPSDRWREMRRVEAPAETGPERPAVKGGFIVEDERQGPEV